MTALTEALRCELNDGPDARNPIPHGCPVCGSDLLWERLVEWRFYPDGNGFRVSCDDPACSVNEEVFL